MITRYKAADPSDPTSKAEYKVLAAGAQRYWHGTRAAFEQVKDSIPNNTMICITDDNGAPAYYARNPVWSEAVEVTRADLVAGYTAPSDGMIIGYYTASANSDVMLLVNNIAVAIGSNANNAWTSRGNVQTPVNKGDIIKFDSRASTPYDMHFVPFEDSVADPMVITADYIRNQNILSDYEDITISRDSANPTVMQYDGFIYISTMYSVDLYINTTSFLIADLDNGVHGGGACMVAIRKGDRAYIHASRDNTLTERVAYYKLRDYTGR